VGHHHHHHHQITKLDWWAMSWRALFVGSPSGIQLQQLGVAGVV
jgi:hypothetical protein